LLFFYRRIDLKNVLTQQALERGHFCAAATIS